MEQAKGPYGLAQWVEFLTAKPLPVLARTIQLLKHRLKDPDLSLQQLVPVVRQDPVLLMHMVRLGNRLNRNKETEVNTAELAVSTLGLDHIAALCEELPVIKLNHASVPHKRYFHAVGNSYHAATQAQNLCRYPGASMIHDTRLAALFYGVGYWALWRYAPQQSCAVKVRIYEQEEDVVLAEHDVLGCTVQQISEALVAEWGLSSLAVQALKHSTSPDAGLLDRLHRHALGSQEFDEEAKREIKQLLNAPFYPVKLANWLALTVPYGWEKPKALRLLEIITDFLKQPQDAVASRLHQNCVRASREHHVPGILAPAAMMMLLPSDLVLSYRMEPEKSAANRIGGAASLSLMQAERSARIQEQAQREQAQQIAREVGAEPAEGADEVEPFADRALFSETAQRFLRDPSRYHSDTAVFSDLLKGLRQGLGLARLSLMAVTEEERLAPLAQAGYPKDHPMRRFGLNLQIPSLFKRLAHRSLAVRADDHNREQVWSELPERFKDVCHPRSFLLTSLFKGREPVAYLYADLGAETVRVSDFHFKYFKYLCGAATRCLNTYAEPPTQDD